MSSVDLIDTTEMYLKTIFEMEEDGINPLRARIVERLGHSGPTVSQTISRMERDNLVLVRDDRRLELQPQGRKIAVEVMRKHRLAERLLVDVIGIDWVVAHDEACRWEHVMSSAVEERLERLLDSPTVDPYGNAIPGRFENNDQEVSLDTAVKDDRPHSGIVTRIGESVQADRPTLQKVGELQLKPGTNVDFTRRNDDFVLWPQGRDDGDVLVLSGTLAPHFFVVRT